MVYYDLVIDIRSMGVTGIGRYLSHIIYKINQEFRGRLKILYLIDSDTKIEIDLNDIYKFTSKKFTFAEQLEFLKLPEHNFLWLTSLSGPFFITSKRILTIHDLSYLTNPATRNGYYLRKLVTYLLILWHSKFAEIIFFDSNFIKKQYNNMFAVISSNHKVIPLGVAKFWEASREFHEIRDKSVFNILVVGSIRPHKNINKIIEYVLKFNNENFFKLQLTIAGSYLNHNLVDSGVLRYKNSESIKYLGNILDDELKSLYENSDLFISASSYEGFGLTVLEAMHCECPLLISDIEAHREICNDLAIYFDPNSYESFKFNLLLIYRFDANKLKDYVRKLKVRSSDFDWSKTCGLIIEFIEELFYETNK